MMRACICVVVLTVIAAGSTQASEVGPIGTYYLTDYLDTSGHSSLDAIQGNTYVQNPSIFQFQEGPIAVFPNLGVLRTTGYYQGQSGGEYATVPSLTVSPTGPTYTNTAVEPLYYDSTTNGSVNFLVDLNTGNVVSTNTTFGGTPTSLFSTRSNEDLGITYDSTNNSLWIQDSVTGLITDYSMTGTVLTSFGLTGGLNAAGYTALAMDVDHTLWFDDYGAGTIVHYTTTGVYLGSASYAGLGYAFGGEIAPAVSTPEPASITLLASGFLAAGGFHFVRRRRTASTASPVC